MLLAVPRVTRNITHYHLIQKHLDQQSKQDGWLYQFRSSLSLVKTLALVVVMLLLDGYLYGYILFWLMLLLHIGLASCFHQALACVHPTSTRLT